MATLSAPAKLTLSLRIVGVRADGYHLIDAEMVTLGLADVVEIDEPGRGIEVVDDAGRPVPGLDDPDQNLVTAALALVNRSARVRIVKRIPAGAGLGGGSADAAAVLRWAGHDDTASAASIGADVPFCLTGGRARVRGIGERVTPLEYRPARFTLLTPPIHCDTAAIYRTWDEMGGPTGANGNDLEPAALAVAPDLARWRDEFGEATGTTPRLAGSGGTWFTEGAYPGTGRIVTDAVPALDPD